MVRKILFLYLLILVFSSCVVVDCVEEYYGKEAKERRRLGINTPENELLMLDYSDILYNNEPWNCIIGDDLTFKSSEIKSKAGFLSFIKTKYYDFPLAKYSILKFESQPVRPINDEFQLIVLDTLIVDESTEKAIVANVTDKMGMQVKGLTKKDFKPSSNQIEIRNVTELNVPSNQIIELVFILDKLNSMHKTIHAIRENIEQFLTGLTSSNFDWRIHLVVYEDEITYKGSFEKDVTSFKNHLPKVIIKIVDLIDASRVSGNEIVEMQNEFAKTYEHLTNIRYAKGDYPGRIPTGRTTFSL